MTIKFSDAWLIQSVLHAEKENEGAALPDLIAYADYVNHAVMTYEEFNEGLGKLKALNLVNEKGKALETTQEFKSWWDKEFASRKRIYVLKELELIESYLKKLSDGIKLTDEDNKEVLISETDFQIAVDKYIQAHQK